MNIDELNFIDYNNFGGFQSTFPLFNINALRDGEIEDIPLNFNFAKQISEIEDIIHKKTKLDGNLEVKINKVGRKTIPKDAKKWDDPTITIKEIIENDLAGTPMEAEIKMREEKTKKMREKKAQKKAEREKGSTVKAVENVPTFTPAVNNALNLGLAPIIDNDFGPKIVFRDGKVVFENSFREEEQKLVIVENKKPYKLTSMSFRTKNYTAKWTAEETRKFYKAIEIFGADFSMIAKLFPTRNRDQIKNKFRKEEKTNIHKIDEAFKKNNTLGKRSLMDRIRNFNQAFNAEEIMTSTNEVAEIGGFAQLERQFSNTSTDSMDLRIMDEIQNIFVNEIKPRNGFVAPFAIGNGMTTEVQMEEDCIFEDTTKKNLLLRF
jgi:hypothetical protein